MKKLALFLALAAPCYIFASKPPKKPILSQWFSKETVLKRARNGIISAAAATITSAFLQSQAPLYFEKVGVGLVMPAFFTGYISPVVTGKVSFVSSLASGAGLGFLCSLPAHVGLAATGALLATCVAYEKAENNGIPKEISRIKK